MLLAVCGGSAPATATRGGGRVQVYEVAPSLARNAASDVITGAVTDHGKDYKGVAGNGTVNKIVLSKGSFEISTAGISPKPPTVNSRTCSIASSFTATVPTVKGSGRGAYTGISGKFKVTIIEAAIAPRYKNHNCNLQSEGDARRRRIVDERLGTVSFK